MTVSSIQVSEGAGKYIHTASRSISSVTREDQYVQLGQPDYPTYGTIVSAVSIATTSDHLLQIMADGTNYCRLLYLDVQITDDYPASGSVSLIQIVRLSTAGTGGSTITPRGFDPADTFGGAAMSLPTAKGTEGNILWQRRFGMAASNPQVIMPPIFDAGLIGKPIIFGTSTATGIAIKLGPGIASCTADVVAKFIVTSYL